METNRPPISDETIEELRALLEKAEDIIPLEWDDRKEDDDGYVFIPQCSYLGSTLISLADTYENSGYHCDLVAESVNALPALLDEVVRLRTENAELKDVLELLHSVQNGCPLYKYEKDWNEAMTRTEKLLFPTPRTEDAK